MNNIFTLDKLDDFTEKLNIDELYESKRQHDLNQLNLYNKLLNRIHIKIKMTSRQKINNQFCVFPVPEVMLGVPKYDQGACIAYLIDKLKENGFNVRYVHPNTIWIAWNHWVPSYVRAEVKKKTGIIIDEYGNKVEDKEDKLLKNEVSFGRGPSENVKISKVENKNYKSTTEYKPSGNLVYDEELLGSFRNISNK